MQYDADYSVSEAAGPQKRNVTNNAELTLCYYLFVQK